MQRITFFLCATMLVAFAEAQTLVDTAFDASVDDPLFSDGEGPLVLFDEGHNNWHTASGRYAPAADVLRNDGFRVAVHGGEFSARSVADASVLIVVSPIEDGIARAIADGIDPEEIASWPLPVPSAYSPQEIDVLVDWVRGGGALMLIVDYMPLAGMSAELAAAFGVHLADGYAYDGNGENEPIFTRAEGSLRSHAVTDGRGPGERIESVRTFGGTAFLVPYGAEPLMLFGAGAEIVLPDVIPPPDTPPPADAPRHLIEGWAQGAVLEVGRGRLALFGEHAAFTAQRFPNGGVTGMNHPSATGNKQLLLNVVRWLTGAL